MPEMPLGGNHHHHQQQQQQEEGNGHAHDYHHFWVFDIFTHGMFDHPGTTRK
jgi:hypothetical protein